ncbi:MAG: response regulator [Firmicutes bacterium]|nr:response regulator [Bacillota bacterium]
MDSSVSFIISSLVVSLIMAFTYFARKKVNTSETKVYSYLIIISILGSIISIPLYFLIKDYQSFNLFTFLIPRLYLLYIMVFVFTIVCYFRVIAAKINEKYFFGDVEMFFSIYLFINLIIILILPMEYHNSNGEVYVNGIAVYYTYMLCALECIYMLLVLVRNITMIKSKKIIPVLILIVIGIMAALMQFFSPGVRVITYALSLIVQIMFFTIENPDVKLLEQVRLAQEETDKANKTKSDFLSIMSHEIRTPLNTIVAFSDSLKDKDFPKNDKEEIKDIYDASLSILETVNGIIDISKLENNTLEIEEVNYQFSKVYDELVMFTKERLKGNKKINFKTNLTNDMPKYLYGDSFRIKQIMLNLLSNAIKYTKEGYIEYDVRCINKGDICRMVITVSDSGRGIKKSNINRIFDDERIINNKNIVEGTGLGLSVTKKLLELMDGQILVQSIYGKGSQFRVVLDQKIVEEQEIIENKERQNKANEITGDLSHKTVLIVDDNQMNLKVAQRLLAKYNINIETANSGFKCLDLVKVNKYDLILLDDMMPKMSGKETLEQLKTYSNFNTPVVVLTANAVYGVKDEYITLGFNDYLSKPIEKDELNRVLKKYLDK